MAQPTKHDLYAQRNVQFGDAFSIEGVNLAGAELKMEIRLNRETEGAALVTMEVETDPELEEALYITVDTSGIQPVSTITMKISRGVLSQLPFSANRYSDAVFKYDLVTTGVGFSAQRVFFRGDFILEGGVTVI